MARAPRKGAKDLVTICQCGSTAELPDKYEHAIVQKRRSSTQMTTAKDTEHNAFVIDVQGSVLEVLKLRKHLAAWYIAEIVHYLRN